MILKDCFGVDIVDGRWLVVAQQRNGGKLFQRRFRNSAGGLKSLVASIRTQTTKPKVCIKSVGDTALNLALQLSSLPEAEVILLSSQGLQHTASHCPRAAPLSPVSKEPSPAEVLARCAERII